MYRLALIHICTWVYLVIPHDELIQVLINIVDSTFNDINGKLISVGKKKAYWVKGFSKTKHKFNVQEVKECFSFLTNNAYFRVGDAIFRQKIGIPMGSDPAPFFANLFLFHYESKWIKTHSRTEFLRARRLFNIFRYIDDLLALNDGKSNSNFSVNLQTVICISFQSVGTNV